MKKVLVIGAGGRCHAIVDALLKSPGVGEVLCAPGNAGIAKQARCVDIRETEVEKLLSLARNEQVDLTVVGPEAALAAGIVDAFRAAGLLIFGPTKAAARIESSKHFAKQLMLENGIPTASYRVFTDYAEALEYVQSRPLPAVLKYDGLAAGKGVVIADTYKEASETLREMLEEDKFGAGKVVVEDYLTGPEFSLMCLVAGEHVQPLALAQDHKRAFDGDQGPNTGGMGAYSPVPFISGSELEEAMERIMRPTARAMAAAGTPFTGVLYGGLIKTPEGIQVIEFNARFGDPETEVILPRLTSDFYAHLEAIAQGRDADAPTWSDQATVGVVLATKGYPGAYGKGYAIHGLERVDATVYHMGTALAGGELVSAGGRVLIVVAEGSTVARARTAALREAAKIDCPALFYRTDIGEKAEK